MLDKIPKSSIIKAVITSKEINLDEIRTALKKFDAYLLLEQYPSERTKMHFDEGALDFTIENLLKVYSEEKKVDLSVLLEGYSLIK